MTQLGRRARTGLLLAAALATLAGCSSLKSGPTGLNCASPSPDAPGCDKPAGVDPADVVGSIPTSEPALRGGLDLAGRADQPEKPEITRAEVAPAMAYASREIVEMAEAAKPPAPPTEPALAPDMGPSSGPPSGPPRSAREAGKGPELSLSEAVAVAVLSHPLMGAQAAKVKGAVADKKAAISAYRPSMEVIAGAGQGTFGSYVNYPKAFTNSDIMGAKRADVGFTFKQLVYDFGAAEEEAARSRAQIDSERLRLADQAEDIALRTVNAYLNLLEQRELLASIDRTVQRERGFASLVKLSEQNGNASKADLDRIDTKVIEAEAVRTDTEAAQLASVDEFRRLTGMAPAQVRRPPPPRAVIPAAPEAAIDAARASNPSLLALRASGASMDHQLSGIKAQKMPRIDLQSDGLLKNYVGGAHAADQGVLDMRAMLTLSYKLFDGGLLSAQADRVRANILANDFKELDERETIELNLRRLYQTLRASGQKRAAAERGLATARSVAERYVEQFKAGKRTVFEVLDSETTVFSMEKNRISGEFEEMRAKYAILRNMGRLTSAIAAQ